MDNTKTNNTSMCEDINAQAVQAMWLEGSKYQPVEVTMKNCEKILLNAFDQAEKELGRPMTYAEMRERFG